MAVFNSHADTPEQIKKEGQQITVKFKRNGDGTGTISWNLPNSINACEGDLVYDGIVITVSEKPANYINSSPKDQTYYTADPTFDYDLHSGDKIDTAYVVGAIYHDKSTLSIIVDGVKDRTPYYVSAYAVDSVGRYHREGTHAYSLPTGREEDNGDEKQPSRQDIALDTNKSFTINSSTGLKANEDYFFNIRINDTIHKIELDGDKIQYYDNFIEEVNKKFSYLDDPILSPSMPNKDEYYVDILNKILYLWDGEQNKIQDALFSTFDPANPVIGTYWVDDEQDLKIYESGGWNSIEYFDNEKDPTDLNYGRIWFDGSVAREWNGQSWCDLPTYVSSTDPSLPSEFTSLTFWYDEINELILKWNKNTLKWEDVNIIYSSKDPNDLTTNDFWYDLTTERVYIRIGGEWNKITNIRYEEPDNSGSIPNPVADNYWFIPSEQRLFQRNSANTEWEEQDIVINGTDPLDRSSCNFWWDASPTVDEIYVWDAVNAQWVTVNNFFQSERDPSLPPEIEVDAVWYNPDDKTLTLIGEQKCQEVSFINSTTNPNDITSNNYWFNGKKWFVWNNIEWIEISVIESDDDPFIINDGEFWFDTNNEELYLRVSGSWELQEYSSEPLAPDVGTFWFDINDEILYVWDGSYWVEEDPIVKLKYIPPKTMEDKHRLRFMSREVGCSISIEIQIESETVFGKFDHPIMYFDAKKGQSKLSNSYSYKELGVGDDGSPDERRKLQDDIRTYLGHPSVKVELTRDQLDQCIDNSIAMIRKYSSYSLKRGMFFLNVNPYQQIYTLKDECVDFNTIATVNEVIRMKPGFFAGTFGGYDLYGYAALKSLYSIGTFDILSYHLVSSYIEELQTLFADRPMFQWIEKKRELRLYKQFYRKDSVLIDAMVERPEQELIEDRNIKMWVKKWALAEAKMILAQARGKFQSLPGPNGSTILNGQELLTQAENEMAQLKDELMNNDNMQDLHDVGMGAHFIIG